eukprot:3959046-Amphidinium_carterae.1
MSLPVIKWGADRGLYMLRSAESQTHQASPQLSVNQLFASFAYVSRNCDSCGPLHRFSSVGHSATTLARRGGVKVRQTTYHNGWYHWTCMDNVAYFTHEPKTC